MTNDGWQDVVVGAICERETTPFPVAYAVYNNGARKFSGGTIWSLARRLRRPRRAGGR